MPDIKSNENEFKSQVNSWVNEFLNTGTYPFECSSSDPSIKVSDKKTKFPDIQIWLNRKAEQGFCGWELKTPTTPVDDSELLDNAAEKARSMKADYFVTWNMREAVIWRTPHPVTKVTAVDRLKSYQPLYQVNVPNDLWVTSNNILLKNRAKEILNDLTVLYQEGHLHQIDVDATYFVGRLNNAVKVLYPHMKQSLLDNCGGDAAFKSSLFGWAVKQSIANYNDPAFYETISRQIVYRLLARILFYQALRRQWSDFPKLDISELHSDAASKKLRESFAVARSKDWHAVFEEDFLDDIIISDEAIGELDKLLVDLNRFNFSMMPQDVIGAVFEKLIPLEERHALGQYFTRENLVDLICAFCVRTKDDHLLDPTCGTGTFLTRAYDRMKVLGQAKHNSLLPQLWGIDIANFPAELATINLFRQNLSDYANFPRIIRRDVFEVEVGQTFEFPPPKVSDSGFEKIEEKLPAFDAAVGNFPYIRQELIEKTVKGYKQILEKTIKEEWLKDYPDVFIIPEAEFKALKKGTKADYSKVGFRLSGQADIYAYLFFHVARFLKEGGRMGFVTSNAWLDVAYGYELQKFFLNNFKIIAILESRCEPWFEDAAVNTVVTIVERCSSEEERDNHNAKFVKVKKKLAQLIPWDMKLEATKRWLGLDGIAHRIESTGKEYYKLKKTAIVNTLSGLESSEDDDFRVRFIKQSELNDNLIKEGKTAKWGQYLRAPQIYFEMLSQCSGKLVPLSELADLGRGIKSGLNDFFYLKDAKIEHWGIEKEFLLPVFKSPKDSKTILIDTTKLKTSAFSCHLSKEKLTKKNKVGALHYIEWGEKQVTSDGILWPDIPSVKNRELWYSFPSQKGTRIVWTVAHDDRLLHRYRESELSIDQRGVAVWEKEGIDAKTLAAILNSSVALLILEVIGRVNLGEGALDTPGEEVKEYMLVPDIRLLDKNTQDKVLKAFDSFASRPIQSIFEEVKMKDRQKLDSLVLEAIGLDPKKYLKPIYDGLIELVRERIELAKMRKKAKQVKTEKDVEKLKKQVLDEVLPYGIKKFPDEFLEASLKPQDCNSVPIPAELLKLGMYFIGEQEVVSDGGFHYQARSVDEAKFIIYSQKPDTFVVSLPKEPIVINKAVVSYEQYLDKERNNLFQEFFKRTFDHKLSETLTQKTMLELGLSK